MRKIILGAILLFSVMGCSEDSAKQDEVANQETSMNIHLSAQKSNITGKDVKRGILPVTVNLVYISVQPWSQNGIHGDGEIDVTRLANTFVFNIVSNDSDGASDGFEIRNFSTGISQFTVTAHSDNINIPNVKAYGSCVGESSILSVNDLFIKWEAKPVAINYTSDVQTIDVKAGINTPVFFTLLPINGRVIAVFQLSDELKDWNYSAKVQTLNDSGLLNSGLIDVDKTHNGVTYLDGLFVNEDNSSRTHTITIFDDKGEKVAEYPVAIDVTNGESTNTIYTILSDQIPESNKLQTTILVPDFKSPPASEKSI
ncbi:hypothetical protein [Flavobacterium granuli]|uniref:Uncharacterized protein n=1 Tax=Flavobacterium granuli TaxID=280093 RepID=A0ABU1RYV4_9FLAO|nr:hypothetical protein [Flavobacterium granuli]MDR6843953.1 hypothetical protein [Flavobacterium granuli]